MSAYYIPGVGYCAGAFSRGGVSYPGNWLQLATPEDLESIGAVPAPSYDPGAERLDRTGIPSAPWAVVARTQAERDATRRAAILRRLSAIDTDSLRPLRAIAAGTATQVDADRLAALEQEAASLRVEFAGLTDQ